MLYRAPKNTSWKHWYTVAGMAEHLGVSRYALRRACKTKACKCHKIDQGKRYVIYLDDGMHWLQNRDEIQHNRRIEGGEKSQKTRRKKREKMDETDFLISRIKRISRRRNKDEKDA